MISNRELLLGLHNMYLHLVEHLQLESYRLWNTVIMVEKTKDLAHHQEKFLLEVDKGLEVVLSIHLLVIEMQL